MSTPASSRSPVGTWIVAGCAVIMVAALVIVHIVLPGGAPVSADPGAPAVPWWATLLPSVVGIAAILLVPWRPPTQPVRIADAGRHRVSTIVLVALAIGFPAVVRSLDLTGEAYVLAKVVMLMLIAGVAVAVLRPAVAIDRQPGGWRWWGPAIALLVWFVLSQLTPWQPSHDFGGFDPVLLIVTALVTAISAGVGEELFYRRWLQTRLEGGWGAAAGIALASLAFALMHIGSHLTGDWVVDLARMIVAQGSFGLFVAVLWWRYRNLIAIIVAHLLVNSWPVLAYVLGW